MAADNTFFVFRSLLRGNDVMDNQSAGLKCESVMKLVFGHCDAVVGQSEDWKTKLSREFLFVCVSGVDVDVGGGPAAVAAAGLVRAAAGRAGRRRSVGRDHQERPEPDVSGQHPLCAEPRRPPRRPLQRAARQRSPQRRHWLLSGPFTLAQVKSGLDRFGQVWAGLLLLVRTGQIRSSQVWTGLGRSRQVWAGLGKS